MMVQIMALQEQIAAVQNDIMAVKKQKAAPSDVDSVATELGQMERKLAVGPVCTCYPFPSSFRSLVCFAD
jgi:hypothetical protein